MSPAWSDHPVDVAVIGSGPAGMAAALEAASAGCSVTVLDSYATPGGQFHRTYAPRLHTGDPAGPAAVAAFRRLVSAGRIQLRAATAVWTADTTSADAGFRLRLTGLTGRSEDPAMMRARTVVLATGAVDRVLPFPGWDLPGVFTAGGAQALLKGQGILPGRRVIVAGSGPFLLPVGAALADAGAQILQVVEATGIRAWPRQVRAAWTHREKLLEAAGYLQALRRKRVPIRTRRAIVRAQGEGRVEQVTIARLQPDWTPKPGTERTFMVDAVCVSFGFIPQIALAVLLGCDVAADPAWGDPVVVCDPRQETTRPGVFAAGEITGVAGAPGAAAEGALAGLAAAMTVGGLEAPSYAARAYPHWRRRAHERRFAQVLAGLFAVQPGWMSWLEDDTVICRCEEVPYGRIRWAVQELGADDLRSVKLTTRCGMGYCQARMCSASVAGIVSGLTGRQPADQVGLSTRPILTPVTLQEVSEADHGSDRGSRAGSDC